MKNRSILLVIFFSVMNADVQAAPRDANGSNKMVIKLQAMVKDLTTERDQLKTEKDKLATEIEQVKKEKSAAASAEDRLSNELSAQRSSTAEVRNRLEQTNAKLLEVIEKYKALNLEKSELTALHANLQNKQKWTDTELQSCEGKNLKMFEAAKEVLSSYEDKGVMDALFKSEPVLQFKSVEMESIVQEYEDRLIKQKYQRKAATETDATQTSKAENVDEVH
ncbi:MAG: hypothetical protein HOP23_01205 [Methylococcaceae bacterium]|nr:hypothetical protein [Methylococcaceae bacterium]